MSRDIDIIIKKRFPDYCTEGLDEYKEDFWRNLSEREVYDINAIHLKQIGDPQYDYLTCWEPGRLDTEEKITDYNTILEADQKWWKFQKDAQHEYMLSEQNHIDPNDSEAAANYKRALDRHNEEYGTYKMYLNGDWYRLFDGDTFLYSQFISARWYIFYKCENLLDDLREECIPYKYSESCEDFEAWINERDPLKRYDAGGRELELEAYFKMESSYSSELLLTRIDNLIRKYSVVFSGKTFRKDTGYEQENFDPFTDFIFFDEQSMAAVSPREFLTTFRARQVDYVELEKLINEAFEIVREDQNKFYQENKLGFV